jgi:hypothetical protein
MRHSTPRDPNIGSGEAELVRAVGAKKSDVRCVVQPFSIQSPNSVVNRGSAYGDPRRCWVY